jgi:hypothetical protein
MKERQIWFGVSALPLKNREPQSWWCAPKTSSAGDLLLLYEKSVGVTRLERLRSDPIVRERRCAGSLMTVDTIWLKTLEKPVTARQIKKDKVLRQLTVVKRNFQGTCFSVPLELWPRLAQLCGLDLEST